MAIAKRMFHVSMICDANVLYDVTAAAAGKAHNVEVQPVVDSTASNGGAPSYGGRTMAKVVLYPWMLERRAFTAPEAIAFAQQRYGHSNSAIYGVLSTAEKKGLLTRTGPGAYQITDKLAEVVASPSDTPAAAVDIQPNSHTEFVLGLLREKGGLKRPDIIAQFEAAGRAPRSVDGVLHKMRARKLIKAVGGGVMQLTATGIKAAQQQTTSGKEAQ